MHVRAHYDYDLRDLQGRLLWLGEIVQKTIARAAWALMQRDAVAAERIIHGDAEIDALRYQIEEYALQLIARHQPIARDLRFIAASVGIAGELERIGDYAEGIGKIVLRGKPLVELDVPPQLAQMAATGREMLAQALRAVVEYDSETARRLERIDDTIDDLYRQISEALLVNVRERAGGIEGAMYVLWAAHDLERIADRTVNIAERAAFMASGAIPVGER